jgi:predicted metal-dependent phosphoesterase TrpH
MFKTETHLHTAEVSACSKIRAKEMIRRYHEAGYSTVFVSDHFQSNTLDSLGDIPWNDKMAIFLSGYYKAKVEGERLGLNVLPAAEFCFSDAPNHYIVYGITKEFLDRYPEIHKLTVKEFSKIAKENNLFVVQAHPYRDGSCFPTAEYIDAVEVYNSNPRHEDHSDLSEKFAQEYNMPVSSGSDAHREEDIACGGIITECEIKSVEDFIAAVKERKVKIYKVEEK